MIAPIDPHAVLFVAGGANNDDGAFTGSQIIEMGYCSYCCDKPRDFGFQVAFVPSFTSYGQPVVCMEKRLCVEYQFETDDWLETTGYLVPERWAAQAVQLNESHAWISGMCAIYAFFDTY